MRYKSAVRIAAAGLLVSVSVSSGQTPTKSSRAVRRRGCGDGLHNGMPYFPFPFRFCRRLGDTGNGVEHPDREDRGAVARREHRRWTWVHVTLVTAVFFLVALARRIRASA